MDKSGEIREGMSQYVVLISRHFYDDTFTTQFGFYTWSDSRDMARSDARNAYPPIYFIHPIYDRLVSYFTGEITKV